MKISLEELNLSYEKVNQLKRQYKDDGITLPKEVEISIDRNPLTDDYFDDKSEFITPFKLKFGLARIVDSDLYVYFLLSEVEVINQDEDN